MYLKKSVDEIIKVEMAINKVIIDEVTSVIMTEDQITRQNDCTQNKQMTKRLVKAIVNENVYSTGSCQWDD